MTKALVLGAFVSEDKKSYALTKAAEAFNKRHNNELTIKLDLLGPVGKGKERSFIGLTPEYSVVSVVGIGPRDAGVNEEDGINEANENVRNAVSAGVKAVEKLDDKLEVIEVDSCENAQASATGAYLSRFKYDELKTKEKEKKEVKLKLFDADDEQTLKAWDIGTIMAEGQNCVRRLGMTPANLLTPLLFVEEAKKILEGLENVRFIAHDADWARKKGMNLFLSVSQGSDNEPRFLEIHYNNLPEAKQPYVLVGKGITFDTGGISIKPAVDMHEMKGDMLGGANVLMAIATMARLKLPVHVVGLIPLSENTINGKATKPGDVFKTMGGKTVEVINTDAEGRLVLADALCYSSEFNPTGVTVIATLTGAMKVILGVTAYGAYCSKTSMWNLLRDVSYETGERTWRLPLFKGYLKPLTEKSVADLANIGTRDGQSNAAALFLREFTNCPNWMHLDILASLYSDPDANYLSNISGSPLRSLVRFVTRYFEDGHHKVST